MLQKCNVKIEVWWENILYLFCVWVNGQLMLLQQMSDRGVSVY